MFTTSYQCSRCGHIVKKDAISCPNCQAILRGIKCTNCGYFGSIDDFRADRCPKCHSIVKKPVTQNIPIKGIRWAVGVLILSLFWSGLAIAIKGLECWAPFFSVFLGGACIGVFQSSVKKASKVIASIGFAINIIAIVIWGLVFVNTAQP